MKLVAAAALAGPNVWSRLPVWEARIDFSGWERRSPAAMGETASRLAAWLPNPVRDRRDGCACSGLVDHPHASHGRSPGSLTWAAELLLRIAQTLHTLSRRRLEFGCVAETCEPAVFLIAVECEEAVLSRACLDLACELCTAAAQNKVIDVQGKLQHLRELADEVCLGKTTGALVDAARQCGVPVRRLDRMSLVQLGHGARQRRLMTAITDRTGKIAEAISLDKDLTKSLLGEIGVPVPEGRPVASREDAWTAACELGLPVVVKPRNGDYGLGVGLNLRTKDDILAAYDEARKVRDEVMVERFIHGDQYRVTVVGHRAVAAVRRVPQQVIGDGIHSVAQLVTQANEDPRRGDDDSTPLARIAPDEDTAAILAEQGLGMDSTAAAGQVVALSRLAHTWAGGEVEDVTDLVHTEVAAQCVRAARLIGIDIAGLDLIADDIGKPLDAQGGAILEVNAGPAIALHFAPFCARPRPVCEAIIDLLFPRGQTGRIPVVLICDDGKQSTTARILETLLGATGLQVGRASRDGVHVGGVCLKAGFHANIAGAQSVMLCSDAEVAILEQSWDTIRSEGLAVDRCDVVVLADAHRARSPEHRRVARLLGEVASRDGTLILDAGAEQFVRTAAVLAQRQVVVTPAADSSYSPLERLGASSRVDGPHDALFVLSSGGECRHLALERPRLPVHFNLETDQRALLHALAAAWALGAVAERDMGADHRDADLALVAQVFAR